MVKPTGKVIIKSIKKGGVKTPVKSFEETKGGKKTGRTQYYAEGNKPILDVNNRLLGIERELEEITATPTIENNEIKVNTNIQRITNTELGLRTPNEAITSSIIGLPETTELNKLIDKAYTGQTGKEIKTNVKKVSQIGVSNSKGPKKVQVFTEPFFSVEGQKQRIQNVKDVGRITGKNILSNLSLGFYKPDERIRLSTRTDSRGLNMLFEGAANNPLITAGLAVSGGAALKGARAGAAGVSGAFQGSRLGVQTEAARRTLQATKAGRAALTTGRLAKGGAIALAETEGIKQTFKGINSLGLTKQERAILKDKNFQRRIKQIEKAQEEEIAKGGFNIPGTQKKVSLGSMGFALNPLISNRSQFIKIAKQQGLTGNEIELALSQRSTLGVGEGVALLNVARFSERFGSKEVSKAFQQKGTKKTTSTGLETFKTTFNPIARAGAIEGAISVKAQQDFRRQERNYKEIAAGAGFGFLSAGSIGGLIAGTKVAAATKGKKGIVSKVITGGSYMTDPFEFPGDKLASLQNKALRKAGFNVVEPSIKVKSVTEMPTLAFGTQTQTKGPKTQIGIPLKTKTQIPTNILTDIKTNIPTPAQVPIKTQINTQTTTTTPTTTTTNILTKTNVPVNIPAQVPVNINIPTITPQLRIPPPFPLMFPGGSGGAGTKIAKAKTFKDELAISQNILAGSLGINFNQRKKPSKKRKRTKRVKRKK
jgi:hypothetical protein